MPTETPASERGAGANANPLATSAIKRSLFQLILLPPKHLTLFKTRSFYILFRLFRKSGVTGNAGILAESMVSNPIEIHRILRDIGSPAGECDNRTACQDRTQVKLHFIDEACVQRLTEHLAAAFEQHAGHISFPQIGENCSERFALIN